MEFEESSVDLRVRMVSRYRSEKVCRKISAALNVPMSKVASITHK